jgi:hypothetical protein
VRALALEILYRTATRHNQLLAHAEGKSLAEHTMQRHVLKRIVVL